MTKSDPVILEVFGESGIALPPAVVEFNITGVSKATIDRRLPYLVEHGLLKKVDERKGYYLITEKGRAYLDGKLKPQELE